MNLGFSGEIGFILLLALVLFGPRKLAELSRQAGRLMADFRKASNTLQNQIQAEIGKLELDESNPVKSLAPALTEANNALESASLTGTLNRLTKSLSNLSFSNDEAPRLTDPSEPSSPQA
jgi:Sec-independent protein translocase protein TatA